MSALGQHSADYPAATVLKLPGRLIAVLRTGRTQDGLPAMVAAIDLPLHWLAGFPPDLQIPRTSQCFAARCIGQTRGGPPAMGASSGPPLSGALARDGCSADLPEPAASARSVLPDRWRAKTQRGFPQGRRHRESHACT